MRKSVIAAFVLLGAPAPCEHRPAAPDEQTASGLRIYIYRLEDGKQLWLGFPGDAPNP